MAHDFELMLPRRVIHQPTPGIVSGGDCGACVLGGLLDLHIETVYDDLQEKRAPIGYGEMSRILRVVVSKGLAEGSIDEPAFWLPYGGQGGLYAFGLPGAMNGLAWFNLIKMALHGGYYGIAHVDTEKKGTAGHGPNHWIAIVGARSVRRELGEGCATWDDEVLVSCSSRTTPDEEWVKRTDFLRHRGGFDILFVKPRETHV